METRSRRQKKHDEPLPSLNEAIDALNLAREKTLVRPTKDAFTSASALLTTTRDSGINELCYVELGLACASACQALDLGIREREDRPNQSVLKTIERLTTMMSDIERNIIKRGKRNALSRQFRVRDDEKAIAAWKLELDKIRQVFETELAAATDTTLSDIHREAYASRTNTPDPQKGAPGTGATQVRPDVLNTPTTASDIHHSVTDPHPTLPKIQKGLSEGRTTTVNMHHNTSKDQQGRDSKNRAAYASAPGESPTPLPRTTPEIISDIHRDVVKTKAIVSKFQHILKWREDDYGQNRENQNSVLGETPPPPPRACFGRDELIERVVSLAEVLNPIALIGAGGIGKTSIALTVLHHSRIKERFGDNRRFIRCDQFTASRANFLNRFSKAVGSGIENPEDLMPLRPFLSSKEMFIVLDNAESILDPQGHDGQEIYEVVEELSQFGNICLAITSRITTVPPDCKCLDIPTISMDAARKTFYRIYDNNERPGLVDKILEQLDFHPLSVTLLATVAHQNKWNNDRLAKEWEQQRTRALQPRHNKSLADTIELSLASPMFKQLGPDARDLLGVIAFFPQGVNENNLDWLFPTTPNGAAVLDAFCVLSLTYRLNGFVTMLVPLRDYLRPRNPLSSPLLRATKESYFARLSARIDPNTPRFGETRWITSEDVNVEHMLNVLTSIDTNSDRVWNACADFAEHLRWHKPRQTVLGPKVEALPDDHPSKSRCLRELARLVGFAGSHAERKRLLDCTLKLEREQGDDEGVALTLNTLSDANLMVGLFGEGIHQAKEALEIYERIGHTIGQGDSLIKLAWLLHWDKQLNAAEEAASRAIKLLPEKGQEYRVCQYHRILGLIYRQKGRREEAIRHLETAIRIASHFNWNNQSFWNRYYLALLFIDENCFDDAHAQIGLARPCGVDNAYLLGRAFGLQAAIFYYQHRFPDATSQALHALEIYRKLGALGDVEDCERLLRDIEERRSAPGESDSSRMPCVCSTLADTL